MLTRTESYDTIQKLVPCLEHGLKMADLLRGILHECIMDDCNKDTLYFISKREVKLREVLKDWPTSDLNDGQVIIFKEIQIQVLEFLKKSLQVSA